MTKKIVVETEIEEIFCDICEGQTDDENSRLCNECEQVVCDDCYKFLYDMCSVCYRVKLFKGEI